MKGYKIQTKEETIPVTKTNTTHTAAIEYIFLLLSRWPSSVDGWVTYKTGTPTTAMREANKRAFTKKKLTACMVQTYLRIIINTIFSWKWIFLEKIYILLVNVKMQKGNMSLISIYK